MCFCVPAMVDVVVSLLTPDQDKILKRHAFRLANEYFTAAVASVDTSSDEHFPVFESFVARLARAANDTATYQRLIVQSWQHTLELTSDGKFPEVLQRMEGRIATECRRNSNLCTPAMFSTFSRQPLLTRFRTDWEDELDTVKPMPIAMYEGCVYVPPMALGAISGEAQKLCWSVLNNWLDITKAKETVFLPDFMRPFLFVDTDAYGKALEALDQRLPPFPSLPSSMTGPEWLTKEPEWAEVSETSTIEEEKALIKSLQAKPKDSDGAHRAMKLFLCFHHKLLMPRRDRIVAAVRQMTDKGKVCSEMTKTSTSDHLDCVAIAFSRFLRPYPIPDIAVHEALLDLAAAGWVSKYFHINLQKVRELIFQFRAATLDDFKAMLLALKIVGDEISIAKIH